MGAIKVFLKEVVLPITLAFCLASFLKPIYMSKRGSPYLRRCIWMASQVAVQRDPMFRAYYEKKAAEGLKYMTIIGHVTRKMTAVVFAILRDHKVYEPVLPTAA